MQHVPGVVASRLGYRRSVARSRVVGTLVFALIASVAATACGSSGKASGFCARIKQGEPAFNSLDASNLHTALAAFDKVADAAPPAVASDLHTISSFRRRLADDPKSIVADPSLLRAYATSTKRVDNYLHHTCGVDIPPPGKLL